MPQYFRGIIELESLNNPDFLSYSDDVRLVKAHKEHHPEADIQHWTVCTVEVPADRIQPTTEMLAQELKRGWYSLFWNPDEVYVVFRDKVFPLPRKEDLAPEKYAEARRHGLEDGVQERYLTFDIQGG